MTGTGWYYGAFLLWSAACMLLVDRRWRLAIFRSPRPTLVTIALCVALLLLWDLAGIGSGIFLRGEGPWQTGWLLASELPVEEVLFLAFLSHLTLVVDAAVTRLLGADDRWARVMRLLPVVVAVTLAAVLVVSSQWRGGAASLTYLALDAAFLTPVLALATLWGRGIGRSPWDPSTSATLALLALLTAFFDSLLIRFGIVTYDWALTSGLRIGWAPLEDFAYIVLTASLGPVLLRRLGRSSADRSGEILPGNSRTGVTPASGTNDRQGAPGPAEEGRQP
ncbi:MAG: lycopene cyclase domain-containing protein [Pauljensenia sp.]